MTHLHDVTSDDNEDGHQPSCNRHHLPTLHFKKLTGHLRKAKLVAANNPATISSPGLAGWVAGGHTHGQTTWAVVALMALMLASETSVKITSFRHRR